MEKAKRISRGSVDTMYALSSVFIDNSTRIRCAARVTNLNSLAQPNHFHHSLLPLLLFATKLSMISIILVSKKRLSEYLAAVCQKELDAEKHFERVWLKDGRR